MFIGDTIYSAANIEVSYQGYKHSVPVIRDRKILNDYLVKRTLPNVFRLSKIYSSGDPHLSGLALSEFYSEVTYIDNEITEYSEAIITRSYPLENTETTISGFYPKVEDMLANRQENGSLIIDNDGEPFFARTYLIGAMQVEPRYFMDVNNNIVKEESKCSFFIDSAAAIEGITMIKMSEIIPQAGTTNNDVVKMIKNIISLNS